MMKRQISLTLRLTLSAVFLSVAITLPLLTPIKELADTLLLMHIPVMLCGIYCGWKFGAAVGLSAPLMRSFIFTMPVLYPRAIYMALELAAYGLVIGLLYKITRGKIYISLISAQIAGRIVWGISKAVLLGFSGESVTLKAFFIGGFIDALPGIALQLIIIPLASLVMKKHFTENTAEF